MGFIGPNSPTSVSGKNPQSVYFHFLGLILMFTKNLILIDYSTSRVWSEANKKIPSQLEIHLSSLVTSDFCCSTPLFFLDFLDPSCFLPRVESSSSSSCHGQGQSGGQNLGFSNMGGRTSSHNSVKSH